MPLSLLLLPPQASPARSCRCWHDSWQQPLTGLAQVVGQGSSSRLPPCFPLTKCCGSQRGLGWLQPSDGGSSVPPWPAASPFPTSTATCACCYPFPCELVKNLRVGLWGLEHGQRSEVAGPGGMAARQRHHLLPVASPERGWQLGARQPPALEVLLFLSVMMSVMKSVTRRQIGKAKIQGLSYNPFVTFFLYSNFHFFFFFSQVSLQNPSYRRNILFFFLKN